MKKQLALSIRNLKKIYPNGTEALKSTTIGVISGLVNKSSGEIIIG